MTQPRVLNVWRRWGYRVLPGDLFSYILHLRPAEWPIMAGHTALGYVLSVGITGVVRGAWFLQALFALAVWVVFLNGGTLAINSVFDRDEGDIGYLLAPPPLPRHLLAFSLALLAGGQLLALALPPAFQLTYAVCFALSILYSVPPFRFKAVAGVDWVINMWGFGTLTPFAAMGRRTGHTVRRMARRAAAVVSRAPSVDAAGPSAWHVSGACGVGGHRSRGAAGVCPLRRAL